MAQPILLKRSSVAGKAPLTANLQYGELSINYTDGALYYLTSQNTIGSFVANGSSHSANILTANTLTVSGNVTLSGNTILAGPVRDINGNVGTNGQFLVSTGSGAQWVTRIVGTLTTATQTNITSVGTLTSISVSGNSNIGNIGTGIITATGNITANYFIGNGSQLTGITSTTAGTVTTNAQPNITSTGTLSSLSDINLSNPSTQQVLTFNGTKWVNADSNATVASAVFASSQTDNGLVNDAIVSVAEDEGFVIDVSNNIYDLGVLSFTGIISLNNIDQSIKSDYLGYSIIFGF